ncbi:hypothetical protein KGM_203065 [Danaus plexippus plexippus]|uniref:Uncharacterized protein n=1 Tax=Danaus plexippus plexippus TaxID=278856 RepID=A0A212FDN8_DANPL|nr:hypothetical protein KGM_203065 [Danaus plexippus plexippus]
MVVLLFLILFSVDSLTHAYNGYIVPAPVMGVAYAPAVPVQRASHTHTVFINPESARTGQDARGARSQPETRKLLSSILTLPGIVADKLISGEISV